jgi:hypothetical protein
MLDNFDGERWLREHHKLLDGSRSLYEFTRAVTCPYFKTEIALTSDGFNHLLHKSNRLPRNITDTHGRFRLLKKSLQVLRSAGTVQEYRCMTEKFGKVAKDGFTKTKKVEYWAFHDIVMSGNIKFLMRVIVRKVGDGKYHFWSVMSLGKQKLHKENIEDD